MKSNRSLLDRLSRTPSPTGERQHSEGLRNPNSGHVHDHTDDGSPPFQKLTSTPTRPEVSAIDGPPTSIQASRNSATLDGALHLGQTQAASTDAMPFIKHGEDAFEEQGRRKRRKTSPPGDAGQQAEDPRGQSGQIEVAHETPGEHQHHSTALKNENVRPLPSSNPGKGDQGHVPVPSKVDAQSPPKKKIKVRRDGKLASPKAKPAPEKKRRGRPPNNKAHEVPVKVVVMRYSTQNRSPTGSTINSILAGTARAVTKLASKQSPPKARTKPSESPKTLHPLFLGRPGALTIPKEQKSGNRTSPRKQNQSKNGPSPVKKIPHRPSSASANAKGWPTFSSVQRLRTPAAPHPQWPSKGRVHVRDSARPGQQYASNTPNWTFHGKLKQSGTQLDEKEQVTYGYVELAKRVRQEVLANAKDHNNSILQRHFDRPSRVVSTGKELQLALLPQFGLQHPSHIANPRGIRHF